MSLRLCHSLVLDNNIEYLILKTVFMTKYLDLKRIERRAIEDGFLQRKIAALNEKQINFISHRAIYEPAKDELSVGYFYMLFEISHADAKRAMHPFDGVPSSYILFDDKKTTAEIAFIFI